MAREMCENGTLFSTPLRGIRSRNEIKKMAMLFRNGS
jgi:hypothetical protein